MYNLIGKSKNKGFTLIEMIVVVLIIGMLASLAILSISALLGANVTRGAQRVSGIVAKARMISLSSADSNVGLKIYKENDNYYANIVRTSYETSSNNVFMSTTDEPLLIGNKNLTIKSLNGDKITENSPLYIYFIKGKGSFKENLSGIKISNSSRDVKIRFVKETGRTYIEKLEKS